MMVFQIEVPEKIVGTQRVNQNRKLRYFSTANMFFMKLPVYIRKLSFETIRNPMAEPWKTKLQKLLYGSFFSNISGIKICTKT